MPPDSTKIGITSIFVVVIVVAFTHHQKVEGKEVSGGIFGFKVSVTIFMGKPVNNSAMYGGNGKLDR